MKMSDGGRRSLCDDCETPAFNIGFNKALSVGLWDVCSLKVSRLVSFFQLQFTASLLELKLCFKKC